MGGKTKKTTGKKEISIYEHTGKKRLNNPPVGLVTSETDKDMPKKTYAYDPHIDPQLQWSGKAERLSFDVPTVSLHVHERIDPRTIINQARRRDSGTKRQKSIFEYLDENQPLRTAMRFYQHPHGWSNRLLAGDSLLVMNSLIEKEGMAGQVQMVYIDPPYGIKYGSNFQPFVNKKDVKDGSDEDLSQEPEMIKAFRDTWELGIHSYLTYLRDRLHLARELLSESGSIFVQISQDNLHYARLLLDEVFGAQNFSSQIAYYTTGGFETDGLSRSGDYVLWYYKDITRKKYHPLFIEKTSPLSDLKSRYDQVELPDGTRRALTPEDRGGKTTLPDGCRFFQLDNLQSQGDSNKDCPVEIDGRDYRPNPGSHWKANYPEGMERLKRLNRIQATKRDTIRYVRYFDDFPYTRLNNIWTDIGGSVQSRSDPKIYVVQTGTSLVQRCMLMTTDPGDLVLDPTCGSGTTAYVAEQWGRRWITCDTSRVAITLAKQRLMTSLFKYYELASKKEGVGAGFKYKIVPRIRLETIANDEPAEQNILYDQPFVDIEKVRVSGPFTVEAVPSPTVTPLTELNENDIADESIARTGETLRQSDWRSELYSTGIRGKGGQKIEFSRVDALRGTHWLHADAETKEDVSRRAVVSFGPDHSPLDQKQVERALKEAEKLVPRPRLVIFAAFQFDPEASKDIDETNWPGVTLLKAQMNADLLTMDLKKKRASNESFWLVGQPDAALIPITDGADKGKYVVEIRGFDYYNVKTGDVDSGGPDKIAMWMLDTDYDQRSLTPNQVFFPMSGKNDGWARLAKSLKVELDSELIKHYEGTRSIPFKPGINGCVAVKIIDDRGIESLRIIEVD